MATVVYVKVSAKELKLISEAAAGLTEALNGIKTFLPEMKQILEEMEPSTTKPCTPSSP